MSNQHRLTAASLFDAPLQYQHLTVPNAYLKKKYNLHDTRLLRDHIVSLHFPLFLRDMHLVVSKLVVCPTRRIICLEADRVDKATTQSAPAAP